MTPVAIMRLMNQRELLSIFDQVFFQRGVTSLHNRISETVTIVCDDELTIQLHADAGHPEVGRIDRIITNPGYTPELLDRALRRLTLNEHCVKAWRNEDVVVLCFESLNLPLDGQDGPRVVESVISALEKAWDCARRFADAQLDGTEAARIAIEGLERWLRGDSSER